MLRLVRCIEQRYINHQVGFARRWRGILIAPACQYLIDSDRPSVIDFPGFADDWRSCPGGLSCRLLCCLRVRYGWRRSVCRTLATTTGSDCNHGDKHDQGCECSTADGKELTFAALLRARMIAPTWIKSRRWWRRRLWFLIRVLRLWIIQYVCPTM